MRILINYCLGAALLFSSQHLQAQTVFIEAAAEIPFENGVSNLEDYEYSGNFSFDLGLKIFPQKIFGIALGYKLDGFAIDSDDGFVSLVLDDLKIHNPYIGVSFQIPIAKIFFIEPQISTGYAFLRYKSEDFPRLAEQLNTEAINLSPQVQFGVNLENRVRIFGKLKYTALFEKNSDGEFESTAGTEYTNIGIGVSLGIF